MERLTKMNETQLILTIVEVKKMKLKNQEMILKLQEQDRAYFKHLEALKYDLDALRLNIRTQ